MKNFDVVVLGADIEGLAAAAHLAQAGRRVLLVDRREVPGGAAARDEFHPSYHALGLIHDAGGTRRALLETLGLERYGLGWRDAEPSLLVIGDGATLRWHRDAERTARELSSSDPKDAQTLERWHAFHGRIAPLVAEVLDDAPPELAAPDTGELFRLAKRGWRLRRLGQADFHTLLRALTLPAQDWTYQWFANPLLRTAATATSLSGSRLGPRASGTGALALLHAAAFGPDPKGGATALIDALVACCEALGVGFLLGSQPSGILVDGDGVSGLRTEAEEISTRSLLSCLGPVRTRALLAPRHAPRELVRAAERWRARGATSVMHIALDHVPRFGPEGDVERVVIARSLEQLERNADALKHRVLPTEPWLDVQLATAAEEGAGSLAAAPAGHAVVRVHVHGTTNDIQGGWTDEARAALEELVWKGLERALPGLRGRAVAQRLLVPPDLEERFDLDGGHLAQGELALDQLWLQRPSLALSRYATGLPGLFLGGGSQHPGGPFFGGAGSLAARTLLAAPRR